MSDVPLVQTATYIGLVYWVLLSVNEDSRKKTVEDRSNLILQILAIYVIDVGEPVNMRGQSGQYI